MIRRRGDLRYTPAGIPVFEFWFAHTSEQYEGGQQRAVYCEIEVVAMDEMAHHASTLEIDKPLLLNGFIQAKSLKNARLVLHLQSLKHLHTEGN